MADTTENNDETVLAEEGSDNKDADKPEAIDDPGMSDIPKGNVDHPLDEVTTDAGTADTIVEDKSTTEAPSEIAAVAGTNAETVGMPTVASPAQEDKRDARTEKLDSMVAHAGTKARQLLSTKNGKIGVLVATVALVIVCLFASHIICFHDWMDATCTNPQICRKCGRSQGEHLGHEWEKATCTEPEVCLRCGNPQGEPLGHSIDKWEVTKEATCTEKGVEAGVCTRCNKEQRRKLAMIDHDFSKWKTTKEASCSEEGEQERICNACGKDETKSITRLDHTPGDWQIVDDLTVTSAGDVIPGKRARVCTGCGTQLETEEYTIELTTSQRNAMRTAASYLSWAGYSYKRLTEQLEYEGFSNEDATFAADHCGADWFVQAEKCAASYMSWASFSRDRLIEQLEYEGFTREQAEHGAASVGY